MWDRHGVLDTDSIVWVEPGVSLSGWMTGGWVACTGAEGSFRGRGNTRYRFHSLQGFLIA
jgi:hypothetical protein